MKTSRNALLQRSCLSAWCTSSVLFNDACPHLFWKLGCNDDMNRYRLSAVMFYKSWPTRFEDSLVCVFTKCGSCIMKLVNAEQAAIMHTCFMVHFFSAVSSDTSSVPALNQSINKSNQINQSNQSINQSIKSINQSINIYIYTHIYLCFWGEGPIDFQGDFAPLRCACLRNGDAV